MSRATQFVLMVFVAGCGGDPSVVEDGGDAHPDATPLDALLFDAGPLDAGPLDAGAVDSGRDGGREVTCTPEGECIMDPRDLRIDVRTASIEGALSVVGELGCASLRFVASGKSHEVALPCTGATRPFEARLPSPRVYDVQLVLAGGSMSLRSDFELDADQTGVAFDVDVVSLDGTLTQNGSPPVEHAGCTGSSPIAVTFRELDGPGAIVEYLPCGSGFTFEAVPLHRNRMYSVFVSSTDGTTSFPDDGGMVRASYRPSTDDVVFDMSSAIVTGSITLEGTTPSAIACDTRAALLAFVDRAGGASHYADVPCDTDWTFAVTLPVGTYDVHVGGGDSNLPGTAHVLRDVTVPASAPLVLDVETVSVPVTLTLNGAPWPTPADCAGAAVTIVLSAEDAAFGIYHHVPCDSGGTTTLAIPPGTYRVAVYGEVHDDLRYITLSDAIEIVSDAALALDVRTVELRGALRVNGLPLDAPCTDGLAGVGLAFYRLEDPVRLWYAEVACDGTFAVRLPPGGYAVVAVGNDASDVLPPGVLVDDRLEVTADAVDLTLDATVVRVSGAITVDGAWVPASACTSHAARVTLQPEPRLDLPTPAEGVLSVPCGSIDGRFEDVPVPAGTHHIVLHGASVPNTRLDYRLRLE